jgi:hypothetical protein
MDPHSTGTPDPHETDADPKHMIKYTVGTAVKQHNIVTSSM